MVSTFSVPHAVRGGALSRGHPEGWTTYWALVFRSGVGFHMGVRIRELWVSWHVAQASTPAGLRCVPAPRSQVSGGDAARNPQAGKPALQVLRRVVVIV